jgi:antitoxin Phd
MIVYTYSEARQRLARLLDQVLEQGEVRIKRKDGQIFVITSDTPKGSPMDVPGIDTGLSASEIVACIQEGRRPG